MGDVQALEILRGGVRRAIEPPSDGDLDLWPGTGKSTFISWLTHVIPDRSNFHVRELISLNVAGCKARRSCLFLMGNQ